MMRWPLQFIVQTKHAARNGEADIVQRLNAVGLGFGEVSDD